MKREIILINKPIHWTSFDVVKKIRNLIKKKYTLKKIKVGHSGTLDPLASGLLVIATGEKTKQLSEIQNFNKKYYATIKLGFCTDSFDRETKEKKIKDYNEVTRKKILKLPFFFSGKQKQIPPKYSAIKIDGIRAYEKTRNKEEFKMSPRDILIYSFMIKKIELPYVEFEIICSKGTYIRSLANDIGAHLKCGAYLFNLERLEIGKYKLQDALDLDQFEKKLHKI